MSRNRLQEIMARRDLHKQRLASLIAPSSPAPAPAQIAPTTPIIPLTPVVHTAPVTPLVTNTPASQVRSPRKQVAPAPTSMFVEEKEKDKSKMKAPIRSNEPKPKSRYQAPPEPVEPEEDEDDLEFSDDQHLSDEDFQEADDFEDEEPIITKPVPTKAAAKKVERVQREERVERVEKVAEPRESREHREAREPQEDAIEASTNALPRTSLSRLLKTAGFGFSQTIIEAATEILQEIVNECIRDKSVTTSDDINKLVNKHFMNGEDDLPEKVVLNESHFSKFVNPLFQARGATCKRDAFYMLHLFCEGFILKMMRAADMVAGNSRRTLIQANDLTIAYNIYSM